MKSFLFAALLMLSGCASARIPSPAFDPPQSGNHVAVLAGGCFWGMQGVFQHVRGVVSATAGYAGGSAKNANYRSVSTGNTGHAESVKIVYDASRISYGKLLEVFFSVAHDPTEIDRQGPDEGNQYRSGIFATDAMQKKTAESYITQLEMAKAFHRQIATKVRMLPAFYPAENHHQNFETLHPYYPYIVINDLPKIENLKNEFPGIYVS
ncbi:MAG TPA: peptide-methionine (S)-S-oxide reductase MsrA, partial [Burkholderiales bacterium]|nr:peptide-methionine (S)-S-oxide reductase MsrA [Burkholderiales bacterium]